jgi:hypothetical protein
MNSMRIRLMLDSGAYTAFHFDGVVIDLDAYCRFVERNKRSLWQYINLDDIGNDARSAEQSAINLQIMKARGLTPIPVFHCGEPIEWLKKMINDGEKYIALSLSSNRTLQDNSNGYPIQKALIDQTLDVLAGHPDIKLHLLGIMAAQLLQPYRQWWYSTDSSSWVKQAKYGSVRAPYFNQETNEYDYLNQQIVMNVDDLGKSPVQTRLIARWLEDNGFGPGPIALLRVKRNRAVHQCALLRYYQLLCKGNGIIPVFATLPQFKLAEQHLNVMGAEYQLLSYHKIKHWDSFEFGYYVKYGKPPITKNRMKLALLDRAAGLRDGSICAISHIYETETIQTR